MKIRVAFGPAESHVGKVSRMVHAKSEQLEKAYGLGREYGQIERTRGAREPVQPLVYVTFSRGSKRGQLVACDIANLTPLNDLARTYLAALRLA